VLIVWDNCALAATALQVREETMAAQEPSSRLVCGSVCSQATPGRQLLAMALPADKGIATKMALPPA
jgi:hypothetical protein